MSIPPSTGKRLTQITELNTDRFRRKFKSVLFIISPFEKYRSGKPIWQWGVLLKGFLKRVTRNFSFQFLVFSFQFSEFNQVTQRM